MNAHHTDRFEIINGPEDGVSFSISRTPLDIGADPQCGIFINFDPFVRAVHARATVVSGGYRIRALSADPVYVNGERSGMVLARVAHSGDVVRIGNTSLVLMCVPDGLAERSVGVPMESNLAWLARLMMHGLFRAVSFFPRLLVSMPGGFLRVLIILAALAALIGGIQSVFFRGIPR